MRKILFLLTGLLFMLAGCSDGGSDSPENPNPNPTPTPEETASITCSTTSLSLGYEGGEKTLSFTTNKNWTISIASGISWCTISQTAGAAGAFNVSVKVSENQEYDERNVTISIKCDNATHNVVLTQKQKDALLITTNKYEVDQTGGTIEVEVKANIDYQVQIAEASSDWIKESSSRGLSSHKHSFTIAESEEYDKREGEIHFKSGNRIETVKVYQTGGAILVLSKNEYTVSDKGENIFVELKSNTEYGVQMPNVDWITDVSSSRGISSHTLKYVVSTNETYDSRSAEIIFYDKNSDLKDTLKIVQVQKDAIIVSEKNISVEQKGGTIEVKVNSNIEFDVQIPSDITWVTKLQSRSLTENKIYLKVTENTNENERKTEIMFVDKESKVKENITLCQAGLKGYYADGIVTIVKAGTIKELLGHDYQNINSLKVIGPINGTDIRTLREMAGSDVNGNDTNGQLQILNISECNIVEGGEAYIFSEYTTNNTVGVSMFQNCSSLKELYLPETITKIEEFALAKCTQLKIFNIPKNVITLGKEVFEGCSSLDELIIPSNINSWKTLGNTSICSIIIESGVEYIPYQAFRKCKDLKKITIPKTVTHIESGAFYYPNDMKEVYVDDLEQWLNYNWKYVNNGCDYPLTGDEGLLYIGGEKIKKITIPNTYTSIPKCAFHGCTNIELITLPNTLESIGELAFSKTRIKEIEIPNSVKNIGASAFSDCLDLESVRMSNMVTKIPNVCFYNCEKLKFEIPSSIQDFGYQAFLNCKSLEKITIPNGIVSLGSSNIFENCVSVKTITLPSSLESIGMSVFGNVPASTVYSLAMTPPSLTKYSSGGSMNFDAIDKSTAKLYVPKGSSETYRNSDWGKYFFNIIEID